MVSSRHGRFTFGKEPLYPLNRSLGGPQSRSERSGAEKNLFPTDIIIIIIMFSVLFFVFVLLYVVFVCFVLVV